MNADAEIEAIPRRARQIGQPRGDRRVKALGRGQRPRGVVALRIWLRLLPAGAVAGWGSHPLESAAWSRRTREAVIPSRLEESPSHAK